jgi:putative ABC transport system permease protein
VLGLLRRLPGTRSAPVLLALERAHHERHSATVAVAGVVASLSLAVALTVMVGSFREGVTRWLDQVLPADLYARTATRSSASDGAYLPEGTQALAAQLPGVLRAEASRLRSLTLAPGRPAVTLIARPITDPAGQLPLTTPLWTGTRDPALPGVYVSEALQSLYGAVPGSHLELPPLGTTVQVLGVWRDYARQFGTVVMDAQDYQRLTGDTRTNDLALWLAPGASVSEVQTAMQQITRSGELMEYAVPGEIRTQSLRVFDRSFAVTHYLQALAMGIGLFGIAASFSAQVLSRRREFGLLAHLGFTRQQVLVGMAAEGAAWTAAGAVLGTVLGLAVAAVLVMVVNPQSFHWTMPLVVPWDKLAWLGAGVVALASLAAALSARAAVSVQAVRAVKEDW